MTDDYKEKFEKLEAAFVREVDKTGKIYVENYDLKADLEDLKMQLAAAKKDAQGCRDALVTANTTNKTLRDLYEEAREDAKKYKKRKDEAYTERNRVVALAGALAIDKGYRVGIRKHEVKEGEEWDPEWLTLITIELLDGTQLSWHCHDRDAYLWDAFPEYKREWDGTTTEQKYSQIEKHVIRLNGVFK